MFVHNKNVPIKYGNLSGAVYGHKLLLLEGN